MIWSYLELFGDYRLARAIFVEQATRQYYGLDWKFAHATCYDDASLASTLAQVELNTAEFDRGQVASIFATEPTDGERRLFLSEMAESPPEARNAIMADHTRHDWRDLLPKIQLPSLVLVARKDPVFPWQGPAHVGEAIPGADTVFLAEQPRALLRRAREVQRDRQAIRRRLEGECVNGGLHFAYGVNQLTTTPWPFEEDVENYASLGVEALELCEAKLDEGRMEEQLALVGEAGLPITSVQPAVRAVFPSSMMSQPEDRRERLDSLQRTIECIAPYALGAVFVTNTGPAPQGNVTAAMEEVISAHRELAQVAAGYGVRVAPEPLNPMSLNLETAIWTISLCRCALPHGHFGTAPAQGAGRTGAGRTIRGGRRPPLRRMPSFRASLTDRSDPRSVTCDSRVAGTPWVAGNLAEGGSDHLDSGHQGRTLRWSPCPSDQSRETLLRRRRKRSQRIPGAVGYASTNVATRASFPRAAHPTSRVRPRY